ncbi:MAG: lycopene cyclase domain-containing protein [Trebonia sp.]
MRTAASGPVTGLGYTVPAVASVVAVIALELGFLRTGLFRRAVYWVSMVIVLAAQIPVDGWLTKLSAPVVEYSSRQVTGIRGPLDIPLEDFLFGFALVTAALLLWERQGTARARASANVSAAGDEPDERMRARPAPEAGQ